HWLTGLYENENLPGNTAIERTRYILNATENAAFVHFKNIAPGDGGFDPQFQDFEVWPDSGNQDGHFLTAVDISTWANDPSVSRYTQSLRKEVGLGAIIGHEMVGDSWGGYIQTAVGWATNKLTLGAVNKWFLSGEDKNFEKIVGDALGEGNSIQDLRLSYQGWVAGKQLSNGNIQTREEFSQWLKDNLQ